MTATKIIRQRLQDINMTQIELAERAGMTRQNLNNKLSRDNFTAKELEWICSILGLTLTAVSNDGKEYKMQYKDTITNNGGTLHNSTPNESRKEV